MMKATKWEQDAARAAAFVGRVRLIQEMHDRAHMALKNWGDWSADRRGIFPRLSPPSLWNQFKRNELDEYGDEQAPTVVADAGPAKAEPVELRPYDERQALNLDERLHGYGGLSLSVRQALRVAYVTREVPEDQFPRATGCNEDAFCERLMEALLFVERFA